MVGNRENESEHPFIPMAAITAGIGATLLPDVYYETNQIVNFIFVGTEEEWVLIDAGMPKSAEKIVSAAEKRFHSYTRPKAIILTHGHFDHVGALQDLISYWNIPVYAHSLELPYLTGQANYPEPDPSVEGGLLAKIAPLYPHQGIDIRPHIRPLPNDGRIPYMHGWRWLHTPGHAPGHTSFFRDRDRTLIAGDAFITVRQDSLFKVLVQAQEVSGPPRYFTTDWQAAWNSVIKLAAIQPTLAITGHGLPMSGEELSSGLTILKNKFDSIAIPDYGRYH